MKLIKYFLIIIFFISIYNAITYADEEIKPNSEEYKLIKEYREITCAFIDKETDPKTQDRCFEITKKLFELTENKIFLTILARQYMHGIGVAKDLNKGLKFYEEVANSDSKDAVEAQDFLGLYYGYEDNPVKDEIKEEYWVKKAALNGSAFSQYNYARLLKNQGKTKEAVYWLKKAAYNGSLDAKCKLAILLRTGHRVEISRTEAYKLLYEAAEQDFAPAFQELSFYYKEDGNKEKANYWCYKFINSDVFKKVASGMDPVLALNQVYFEQKKKKYIEAQKELQETERANKNDS